MHSFRNIDNYVPLYYEKQGMLKNKLWFEDRANMDEFTGRRVRGLFKPRRKEFKSSIDLFCGNHYGEVVGSELAKKMGMEACDSELVNVNTEKNKYTRGRIVFKEGCIIYSKQKRTETLIPGKIVVDKFKTACPEKYDELAKSKKSDYYIYSSETEANANNIEIVLAAIEYSMQTEGATAEEIAAARRYMLQMVVYDCVFGNNDRHDENWSLVRDLETGKIKVYPAYDNERVLGLYENHRFITEAVRREKAAEASDIALTSRMGIPGMPEKVKYSVLLEYLSEHYPEEMLPVMKQVLERVSSKDVLEILSACEGLPIEYIEFGTLMYSERRKTVEKLVQKIEERREQVPVEEYSL